MLLLVIIWNNKRRQRKKLKKVEKNSLARSVYSVFLGRIIRLFAFFGVLKIA